MTDTKDRVTAGTQRKQENREAALAECNRACEADPGNPELLFERGFLRLERGDFPQAVEDFTAVLEKRPGDLNSLFNRGLCLLRLTRFAEARDDFSAFLTQVPDDAEALAHRGHCLVELEDPENAVADFDRALQMDDGLVSALFHRGRAFQSLKKWRMAVGDYDRVLQLSTQYDDARFNRAWCRGKLGDHQSAIEDYDRYLEAHPDDVECYVYRGNRYLDLGEYDRAVENYEQAVALEQTAVQQYPSFSGEAEQLRQINAGDPAEEMAGLFSRIGRYRLDAGESKTALLWFNRAIEADEQFAEAWCGRGKARSGLEQYHSAMLDCARAVDLNPGNSQAWYELGTARQKLNMHQEAIIAFSRAIELNRGDAAAYLQRGYSRKATGDQPGAQEDFKHAFQLQPALANEHPDVSAGLEREQPQPQPQPKTEITETLEPPEPVETADAPSISPEELQPEPLPDDSFVPTTENKPATEEHRTRGLWNRILSILQKTVILGAITTLAGISLTKATDVIYTAAIFVGDGIALGQIPTHSEVCKSLYCTRSDTTFKHICGSTGRLSELTLSFCPEHQRISGLGFLDFSLLGTMLWVLYSLCVGVMVLVCYTVGIIVAGGLIVLPVSLKLPKPRRGKIWKHFLTGSAALAVVPTLVSCFIYVWW